MSLRQKNGIWYFRSMIKGKRIEKSLKTRNAKVAERMAGKMVEQAYEDSQGWVGRVTVWEWWETFKESHLPHYKNQRGFHAVIKKIESWYSRDIDHIRPSECSGYVVRRLAEGAPKSSVAQERTLLRIIFQKAVEEGRIKKSPWGRMAGLKGVPRTRVLSREEQPILLAQCRKDLQEIIEFLTLTGLRAEELLGSKKKPAASPSMIIDLPRPGLRITGKGDKTRVVPLSPRALELAKSILPVQSTEGALLARLHRATRRAKIPPLTLHDLRRTFGTRCAERRVPIEFTAKYMGHDSIATTAVFYTHVTPSVEADALFAAQEDWGGAELGEIKDSGSK